MKKQSPPARSTVTPPAPDTAPARARRSDRHSQSRRGYDGPGAADVPCASGSAEVLDLGPFCVLGILAVVFVLNFSTGGNTRSSEAWSKLEAAKKVEERVEVAKEYPKTTAATWALLQAASEYYVDGFNDLPRNPEVALGNFKKAHDLFDQVYRDAPKDSFQARVALLGLARSLEARNDLPKAIEKYELVASNWPGTPEAEQAKQLAEALRVPAAADFYKQLYAYSPPKVTLPPLGSQEIQLPSTGISLPGGNTDRARQADSPDRHAAGIASANRSREKEAGRNQARNEPAGGRDQDRPGEESDNQGRASRRSSRSRRGRNQEKVTRVRGDRLVEQ